MHNTTTSQCFILYLNYILSLYNLFYLDIYSILVKETCFLLTISIMKVSNIGGLTAKEYLKNKREVVVISLFTIQLFEIWSINQFLLNIILLSSFYWNLALLRVLKIRIYFCAVLKVYLLFRFLLLFRITFKSFEMSLKFLRFYSNFLLFV